jgi:hypothetical protein
VIRRGFSFAGLPVGPNYLATLVIPAKRESRDRRAASLRLSGAAARSLRACIPGASNLSAGALQPLDSAFAGMTVIAEREMAAELEKIPTLHAA